MMASLWFILLGVIGLGSLALVGGELITRSRARRSVEQARPEWKDIESQRTEAVGQLRAEAMQQWSREALKVTEEAALQFGQRFAATFEASLTRWEEAAVKVGEAAARQYGHRLREVAASHSDVVAVDKTLRDIELSVTQIAGMLESVASTMADQAANNEQTTPGADNPDPDGEVTEEGARIPSGLRRDDG